MPLTGRTAGMKAMTQQIERSRQMPNKRVKFARSRARLAKAIRFCSRLTRSVGLHIAKNEMSTERNPSLQVHRNRHGAKPVASISRRTTCTIASRLCSSSAVTSMPAVYVQLSQVAPVRAWLPSSAAEFRNVRCSGPSPSAVHRRIVVRSGRAAHVAIFPSLRSTSWPNITLVPTTQSYAPLCPRGAHAAVSAQRGRWTPSAGKSPYETHHVR